jgi:hypothetical protein
MTNDLMTMDDVQQERGIAGIESDRAMAEVKAMVFMAKQYPRNQELALQRIKGACERKALAESSMYSYPRGNQTVSGPSIRLAEVIAQNWGNLDFGIRELKQSGGESEVEAYAWDLETNVRQTKTFKVPHIRHTRSGQYALKDPRDIYEMVANQGARRLRACILGVIPGDIIDEALGKCENTLRNADGRSKTEIIRSMIDQFKLLDVTVEMIELKLGHKLNDTTSRQELVSLGKIHNSLKDGMTKREDWFTVPKAYASEESDSLSSKIVDQNDDKKTHTNTPANDQSSRKSQSTKPKNTPTTRKTTKKTNDEPPPPSEPPPDVSDEPDGADLSDANKKLRASWAKDQMQTKMILINAGLPGDLKEFSNIDQYLAFIEMSAEMKF